MAENESTSDSLVGQRFGKLVVLASVRNSSRRLVWQCKCDCGKLTLRRSNKLLSITTPSCGCYTRERIVKESTTHNLSHLPEYRVWAGIHKRCRGKGTRERRYYANRGIAVCERWNEFQNFFSDMGPRPSAKYSIERIDNDGPYSPENCRWATIDEQANNRRNNHNLTFRGRTQTIAAWARETGISYPTLATRVGELKWSAERALTTKIDARRKTVKS